jgi:5-methylcytosine-specific restriction endonuclease McrA
MIERPVLVLNQSYEPLNVCRARRALVLMFSGRAEMLENGTGYVYTSNRKFDIPSVIRMLYMIKRPHPQPKLTRLEIFNRDHYMCQYCGKESRNLTLDHVIPRHLGGEHSWQNLVSACVSCNRRKAGRTPEQANMRPRKPPVKPHGNHFFTIPYQYRSSQSQWHKYLLQ